MAAKLKDETGNRYGMLVVISRAENTDKHARWNCQCDCGKHKEAVLGGALRHGLIISCGCQHRGRKPSDVVSDKMRAYRKKYYSKYKKISKQ